MLHPANRLVLTDVIRPPEAFRLESAMAVTFTLDLRALLFAPAAMAFSESSDIASDGSSSESVELLHALRSHVSKITVFSQVGEIALPPSRRVFAFLERTVVPVDAPRGGIVHPKAWVLRYESVDESVDRSRPERRLRVLIASRNLTFDTSWDTVVRLDEVVDGPGASLESVGELFRGLLDTAVDKVSADHSDRVRSLSDALGVARFALPAGVDDLRIHVLGLDDEPSPLPDTADRSLIISPFVSDDFFTTRACPPPVNELASRSGSLDQLKPETLTKIERGYVFGDESVPNVDAKNDASSMDDPGRPLIGLHAKVFAFEENGRARLFLGSANATGAAFHRNVEILVELKGSATVLGIDRFWSGTEDPGLRSLFYEYDGSDALDDIDEGPSLDRARREIARLPLRGFVEESGSEWATTYRSSQPVPSIDGIKEMNCWPLALEGHRKRVVTGELLQARFETSLETISGFLAFELIGSEGALTRFVVPVPLIGAPSHRERFLLRALVGNAERFLRYLLILLDEDQAELRFSIKSLGADGTSDGSVPLSLPVLEKMLRTMRRDPGKLAALHPLVSDLADANALPPGFAELWENVHDVALAEGMGR